MRVAANTTVTSSTPILKDRKSTRLNSSHQIISYAVFCLKKKRTNSSGITNDTNVNRDNRA